MLPGRANGISGDDDGIADFQRMLIDSAAAGQLSAAGPFDRPALGFSLVIGYFDVDE